MCSSGSSRPTYTTALRYPAAFASRIMAMAVWSNYSGGAGIVSEQAAEPRIATDGSIN